MEFAHVGTRCMMPQCRQQDFLPFQCEFCGDVHCQNHRRPDDHDCKKGGFASIDDNYVIICPICHFRISMKGVHAAAVNKMGGGGPQTPDELWNKHVESGECQRQQDENKRDEKPMQCQHEGCRTKLTYISRYQCIKCGIYTCLEHRYADSHSCGKSKVKVTQQNTKFSRLLQPGFFDKNSKPTAQATKPISQQNSQPLRKAPASNGAKQVSNPFGGQQQSKTSSQANEIPAQLETCPICNAVFRSIDLLIEHSMTVHCQDNSIPPIACDSGPNSQKPKQESAANQNDTEKCPQCFKRFNVVELVTHMQQDHYIF